MTPKTQYQKMRDNRARRESMHEFEPFSDTQLNGVRFKPGSLWDPARPMVATLEDGSVLTASPGGYGEFDAELSKAMREARERGEIRHGLLWFKDGEKWVHSDMKKKP